MRRGCKPFLTGAKRHLEECGTTENACFSNIYNVLVRSHDHWTCDFVGVDISFCFIELRQSGCPGSPTKIRACTEAKCGNVQRETLFPGKPLKADPTID